MLVSFSLPKHKFFLIFLSIIFTITMTMGCRNSVSISKEDNSVEAQSDMPVENQSSEQLTSEKNDDNHNDSQNVNEEVDNDSVSITKGETSLIIKKGDIRLDEKISLIEIISSGNTQLITSRVEPDADQSETDTIIQNMNIFAFGLYHALRGGNNNLTFSPFTISMVMALLYAGARGETSKQIQEAYQFEIEKNRVPNVFNTLDSSLNRDFNFEYNNGGPLLYFSTATWGQKDYPVQIDFYNLLAGYYCDPIQVLDFCEHPYDSDEKIEKWITDHTESVTKGAIDSITDRVRFVFAATAALNADWEKPFNANFTIDDNFELLDGSSIKVPIMTQNGSFPFTKKEGYEAIQLSFANSSLAMHIFIPESGLYDEFEEALNYQKFTEIKDILEPQNISLKLPKYSFVSQKSLSNEFHDFGIADALVEGQADFSGINKSDDLYLNGSQYKTETCIDEYGAKGCSSTVATLEGREEIPEPEQGDVKIGHFNSVIVMLSSDQIHVIRIVLEEVNISRPFIFTISDTKSGIILFMGRVLNPID